MPRRLLLTALLLAAPLAAAQTAPAAPTPAAVPAAPAPALSTTERDAVGVIDRGLNGIVYIEAATPAQAGQVFSSPLFQDPRGGLEEATGSGFFVNAQGYALTNYHVVEGATKLTVRLRGDTQTYTARLVGSAPDYDLALIQVQNLPAGRIQPLTLGTSAGLRAGQGTIALGAPFGLDFSASTGIVSAVDRTIPTGRRNIAQKAIQTDAAINPGNSGGPLLNSAGQVIGINTQIFSPAGSDSGIGQSSGVGFAIPIDVARELLPRLQAGQTILTPVLGVVPAPFDLDVFTEQARTQYKLPREGALLLSVDPNGPAARAGVRGGTQSVSTPIGSIQLGGDVITAIDGQPVTSSDDLRGQLFRRKAGDTVRLTIVRAGQTQTLNVTLAAGTLPTTR